MRLSAEQARARFADSLVAVLGTVDATGHVGGGAEDVGAQSGAGTGTGIAHLVPVTYVVSGDLVFIAIDDKPKRGRDLKRLRNIAANPRVCLLAQHYQEDWSGLWWARADGTARIIEPSDLPFGALGGLVGRYGWYRQHPPAGPVIEVTVHRWSGWAFAESPPALDAPADEVPEDV